LQFNLPEEKKKFSRQILSLLAVVFPEYEKTALRNVFGIASRKVLERWPTAFDLAEAKVHQIEKLVRSIKGNNFNISEIERLIEAAKNSIYSGRAREIRAFTIRVLLFQLDRVSSSLGKIKEEIDKILSPKDKSGSFPGNNLLSAPAVGKNTLAVFLSVAGSKGVAFPSSKKLIGHIGFFPQICESGEKRRDNIISRRGPNYVRKSLYMAAVSSIRHNRKMRTLYNKKISQGKSRKQALIYVAKKLAQMMLSMLKSGETYRPERVFVSPTALPRFQEVAPAS
ncbi:MAG: transposase, partial [Candidatus Ratteibacteria bacterium]